jgi:hypothetical protein
VLLQIVNHLEGALSVLLVGQRMEIRESADPRDAFVESRVVLHRAGTQGIHADVDRVVPGRHANEVTNNIHFAHFGHAFEIVITTKLSGNI